MPGHAAQARLLEGHIIVSIEIVHTDDFVASREQPLNYVHADESGDTRYKYFHCPGTLFIVKCVCLTSLASSKRNRGWPTQAECGVAALSRPATTGDEYSGTQSFSASRT